MNNLKPEQKRIWLLNTLMKNPDKTREEICVLYRHENNEKLPKSTFFRLLKELRDDLGVECVCEDQRYRITNAGKLRKDNNVLLERSIFTLSNIATDLIPNARYFDIDDIPVADDRLSTILSAHNDRRMVQTFYRSEKHQEGYDLVVEPWGVKLHEHYWVMVGRSHREDHAGKPMRTFRLDRMSGISVTDAKFRIPKDFSITEYFENCIGIFREDDKVPEPVIINVYDARLRRELKEVPLHKSQFSLGSTKKYDAYSYRLRPTEELVRKLLSLGPGIKVMGPESLQQKYADAVRLLAESAGLLKPKEQKAPKAKKSSGMLLENHGLVQIVEKNGKV